MGFPESFLWGVGTSAYQIEGAVRAGGRSPSIWDTFCQQPGAIMNGDTGATACDHYHRYQDDVALMKTLGLKSYRFSIAWPRVLHDGTGQPNPPGLDFYDQLVDELLAAQIEPFVTLYHWDMPQVLEERGGWLNREVADWFAYYTAVVATRLGDRVKYWLTLNEPAVPIAVGYGYGSHAPGHRYDLDKLLLGTHHELLAHGRAVSVLRSLVAGAQISLAPDIVVPIPISATPADIEAARQLAFTITEAGIPAVQNLALWLDPVVKGTYPAEVQTVLAEHMPDFNPDDLAIIAQPIDFIGINIYRGDYVQANNGTPQVQTLPAPQTALGWHVTPEALYWGPRFLWERYKLPLYITENGLSNNDWIALDGGVHDPQRIDFTSRYLMQLLQTIDEGVDVRGYFHWSLMDNFEWAGGYRQRFGLIYVNYETQERILKDSARWYARVIASNGALLPQNGPNLTHKEQIGV